MKNDSVVCTKLRSWNMFTLHLVRCRDAFSLSLHSVVLDVELIRVFCTECSFEFPFFSLAIFGLIFIHICLVRATVLSASDGNVGEKQLQHIFSVSHTPSIPFVEENG